MVGRLMHSNIASTIDRWSVTPTLADRALDEYDLSPDDRRAAVQLLVTDIASRRTLEVRSDQIARVLRAIDCEFIAHRHHLVTIQSSPE